MHYYLRKNSLVFMGLGVRKREKNSLLREFLLKFALIELFGKSFFYSLRIMNIFSSSLSVVIQLILYAVIWNFMGFKSYAITVEKVFLMNFLFLDENERKIKSQFNLWTFLMKMGLTFVVFLKVRGKQLNINECGRDVLIIVCNFWDFWIAETINNLLIFATFWQIMVNQWIMLIKRGLKFIINFKFEGLFCECRRNWLMFTIKCWKHLGMVEGLRKSIFRSF